MPMHAPTLSNRTRVYLIATVAFIVLSFLTTVAAVMIVNRIQENLVEEARQSVRNYVKSLGESAGEILNKRPSLDDGVNEATQVQLRDVIQPVMQQEAAFTYFTLILDGETAYYVDQDGNENVPASLQGDIEITEGEEEDYFEVDIPIHNRGDRMHTARIVAGLSPLRIEGSIKETATTIRKTSRLLVGLLLLLMLLGIAMLARAMSHLVALNDETNRLDRLAQIGTFAAGLAHEIRNPLNAMNINLELVEDDVRRSSTTDPATNELIGGVKREITHLNKIVSNFLTYARPTKHTAENLSLAEAVRDAVNVTQPQMQTRGVTCHVDIPEGLSLKIDPTAIHQTLTNLIINAAEAMDGPKGEIRIDARSTGNIVTLRVSDNGKGIAPDKMEKIFDVFYTDKVGGSGLGLPTAKRMIEDSGGKMEIDSVAGHGTTFTMTFNTKRRGRA